MDYIREFDIRLEKEMYYAGETLSGHVILDTVENFKLKAIRVMLRGKAHAEWKVVVSGDRRTVKDDHVFIDDRTVIWGKEKVEGSMPILPRGRHSFPFRFQLPESSLPCSFESKPCTVRYYVKVTVDIPYASPPQGMKYFTIIGPHIDCMDEQYLKPLMGADHRAICCLCCKSGVVSVRCALERSAYCCGESIRLKADIDNQSDEVLRLRLKLVQYVEFFIDRGVLGISKEANHTVLEYRGDPIQPQTRSKFDSSSSLVVPVMPPTLIGVCRLLQIYYVLKVWVEMEKSGDDLHMNFPITIATCPFRIPNSNQQPRLEYEMCCDHVEGGMYIGPEFLLGQVYDGTMGGVEEGETVVLYRPVYVCVKTKPKNNAADNAGTPQQQQQRSAASVAPQQQQQRSVASAALQQHQQQQKSAASAPPQQQQQQKSAASTALQQQQQQKSASSAALPATNQQQQHHRAETPPATAAPSGCGPKATTSNTTIITTTNTTTTTTNNTTTTTTTTTTNDTKTGEKATSRA